MRPVQNALRIVPAAVLYPSPKRTQFSPLYVLVILVVALLVPSRFGTEMDIEQPMGLGLL
jgi:hypothetical protein